MSVYISIFAAVVELADTRDLKSAVPLLWIRSFIFDAIFGIFRKYVVFGSFLLDKIRQFFYLI